jgi:hypothetical protein
VAKNRADIDIVIKNGKLRFALHRRSHAQVQFDCDVQTEISFTPGLFETKPKGRGQAILPAGKSYLTLDPKTAAGDFELGLGPRMTQVTSVPITVGDDG